MLKDGVKLLGIKPEMCIAYMVAAEVYKRYNLSIVMTSCTDGKHGKHSHHYKGYAIDLRTRDTTPVIARDIARDIQLSLTSEFQVFWEKTHIHIEYDPL